MLAFDVLRVRALVDDRARDAIRVLRYPSCDKAIDVKRDSPDCDRFVTSYKSLREVLTRGEATLTSVCLA